MVLFSILFNNYPAYYHIELVLFHIEFVFWQVSTIDDDTCYIFQDFVGYIGTIYKCKPFLNNYNERVGKPIFVEFFIYSLLMYYCASR